MSSSTESTMCAMLHAIRLDFFRLSPDALWHLPHPGPHRPCRRRPARLRPGEAQLVFVFSIWISTRFIPKISQDIKSSIWIWMSTIRTSNFNANQSCHLCTLKHIFHTSSTSKRPKPSAQRTLNSVSRIRTCHTTARAVTQWRPRQHGGTSSSRIQFAGKLRRPWPWVFSLGFSLATSVWKCGACSPRWVYFGQLELGKSWPTELPSGNLMGKIHHFFNGKISTISTGPFSIANC